MGKFAFFFIVAAAFSSVSAQSPVWGQCGGMYWTGPTTCAAGSVCTYSNDWYSQCLPGTAPTTIASSTEATSVATSIATTSAATSVATSIASTSIATSANPAATNVPTGSLQEIKNFGTNPTNVRFFIYVPSGLAANPPIVVVAHYCTGSANAMYTGTPWKGYADTGKFLVIYPQAPDSGGCWDVHTAATLTHNAGGDSLGIVSAVRWSISNFSANASRVYMTGISSGAMMTNVILGAYPDVFAAGSAFAGVPYSCFSGATLWNSACANGQISKTGAEWGNAVRNGYPGYTGTRPKMQVWHGTADTTLYYQNFNEEIKQWTNVFGVSATPSATVQNYAASGWTRTDYGPNFMAISAQGVSHSITYQGTQVKAWFGL